MAPPFPKILIANRGEIACRVIRTARRMGVATVAVHSDADADALHVALADEAVRLGPAPAAESYLRGDLIVEAARRTGAAAIHPGYGFLSENPDFVEAVEAAGLVFIGPSAAAIRAMGLKDAAKDLMAAAGVPVVPGYQGAEQDPAFLAAEAGRIGYPVLIKARAGGGGKGMRRVDRPEDFADALASARREGESAFGDGHVLIEKYIDSPRHIEVQVFGDGHGTVVHLFERDCSLQRRHQKVIEEAPAPGMTAAMRDAMTSAAVTAARSIGYSGAGTVEFIADGSGPLRPDGFWFMEMNTRLQVEHPVTEAITGIDLVEWQLRVAAGEPLPVAQDALSIDGHAFEARLYAEDPANGFLPSTGRLHGLSFGEGARIDTGVREGDAITPFYDPMIAKVITHGPDRDSARRALVAALEGTQVAGTATNAAFLARLAAHEGFAAGVVDTGLIGRDGDALTAAPEMDEVALAFAAIEALGLDPDAPHFGWRLFGPAEREVTLIHAGAPLTRRLAIHSGGTMVLSGGCEGDLTLRGFARDGAMLSARVGATGALRTARSHVAARPAGRLVSILADGTPREFLLPDPRAAEGAKAAPGDSVAAPMTGVLVRLDVAPGDEVEAGARLGVVEAMKMETALVAPRAGRVAAVHAAAGDAVEGGRVLVSLEPEDG